MTKTALITGATSGIGKAIAELLAEQKYHLILTGRREDHLLQTKDSLLKQFPTIQITMLCFDVRIKSEVDHALSDVKNVDVLINNAGLAAGLSRIYEGDTEDWEQMIDTNIKGLLYVTRVISPRMIENKGGHIVNIGSIAGKEVYDKGNVYCGTKHMVDALSKSMRLEMAEHNIKVTVIHPGAVETEFSLVRFKGDQQKAEAVYQGFENLVAKDIAEAIGFCLDRPEHVNINEMTIMPKAQPMASQIIRNKGL
jgi:NADP-dependent 3-hydroxy acid dehydrogenase YdfG